MKRTNGILVSIAVGVLLVGCSQSAKDEYKEAGQAAGDATTHVGKGVTEDTEQAKLSADNALLTSKVKSALGSAAGLETKGIDVDSDTLLKTITLKGTVPDGKQKAQAETVATGIAGKEFTVKNMLNIAGK